MPKKGSSFWVFAFGYVIFAVGVVGVGWDFYSSNVLSYPFDMGTFIGDSALCLLGLTTQVVAHSLKRLENRLDDLSATKRDPT